MKTAHYLKIAITSYWPISFVIMFFYICLVTYDQAYARAEGYIIFDLFSNILALLAALVFTLLQAALIAVISRGLFYMLDKHKVTRNKQLVICGFLLTFWYLPLTLPGTLSVFFDYGASMACLNLGGAILLGLIFCLLPTLGYLFKLSRHGRASGHQSKE